MMQKDTLKDYMVLKGDNIGQHDITQDHMDV